jgi:teichuronic acid biosynthesis glycosyltransferase TuaC
MNLLVVVSNYPHHGHVYSGAFNERSALELRRLGHQVDVVAPRPYVPRGLGSLSSRWRSYEKIQQDEVRAQIPIYRPAYWQLPRIGGAIWCDRCAYLASAREIQRRHRRAPYDAILSFNLVGAGGVAWRLGRRLAIPVVGWATGNDVRVAEGSSYANAVRRALRAMDLVFYQSRELRDCAARLLQLTPAALASSRHVVLARGVESPPDVAPETRRRMRGELGVAEKAVVVLYLGRIAAAKGVFDLAQAIASARALAPELICWMVGVKAGFDDSAKLAPYLQQNSHAENASRLIDACPPEKIWEYFAAADIFAFPSHSEGMPNSLLEAMSTGLPALAYAIPPVEEIDNGGALAKVPPHDIDALSHALVRLASDLEYRDALGRSGRARVHGAYLASAQMAQAAQRIAQIVAGKRPGSEVESRTALAVSNR